MSNKATVTNLRATIIPKSDQLNAQELIGGPITIKITNVVLTESPDQPVIIHYEGENGRPWKPCKSMRVVLIFAWGDDGTKWIGRHVTLFNDPEVKWAGVKAGGIRISHMSHIDRNIEVSLTVTRGKKAPFVIKELVIHDAAGKTKIPQERINARIPPAAITDDDIASARSQLETAAPFGMQTLQKCWAGLSAEIRTALGGSCPQEYKDVANSPPPVEDVPAATDNDGEMF